MATAHRFADSRYPCAVRRALRLAGLAVALSLWVVAARASAESPPPGAVAPGPASSAIAVTSAGPTSVPSAGAPVRLTWEVVSSIPHDPQAWTEGLLIDGEGRLFESTGLVGRSSVRELDRSTGAVLRSAPPPGDEYGEGLAVAGDDLLQLTWKDGVALAMGPGDVRGRGQPRLHGRGLGPVLGRHAPGDERRQCHALVPDPVTFELTGTLDVTADGKPVPQLNELDCVGGDVWANVWETPYIARIDAATGVVTGVLDMTGLIEPDPSLTDPGAVLNGIAHDPTRGTFLVTGKLWPTMFEIRVGDPA